MKPRLRGQATLVRYADDFVVGFESKDDAQRVMDALGERLGNFGLTLHPDKTRLLFRSLLLVIEQATRSWYKWLCRRSQRQRLTWERFADLLRDFPLPKPRIRVRIWGA